jgi:hypothetical protein
MKTFTEQWETYVTYVYPEGIDPASTQYIECRRAFMAGTSLLFDVINEIAYLPDDIAIERVKELRNEMKRFLADVQAGVK